ncbi:four-carbon acid sugar kinase family protein [Pararhizobium sp. BT-229]|uniref:four-carbon acid sugar kinase family protein n=1 Tax=Pararhizobium sp. BT-229 TaxID=2986923 RepID=UPI0021F766AF|nr:four-carbon acid sugar kinase family protein [Pararhizobium sp. BT-229]MCV9967428.1 four-carbon acid sugar kinase family protein [Pararhizobium sp. BT-229]
MLTILADDLTGALDTAAPFAARGMHVEVALSIVAIGEALGEAPDVLSINLDSREFTAEAARLQTKAALASLPAGTRLFKKVDSRLKGHIAAELDAMSFRSALAAPAIPAFGRVVKDGCVTGFGVDTPISVAEKLGVHAVRATIPDVSDQSEMHAWLDQSENTGIDLLIGARGLAEALAERMSKGAPAQTAGIPGGPALFVIGSRDPITLAQIDALRGDIDPRYLPAPNGHLAHAPSDGSMVTLVQAVPGKTLAMSGDVSHALAESVFPGLTGTASTLLLSGGATAQAVLKIMGIVRLRLLGECLPGLGLAHAQGHCIIAKSGGFGGPDTLKEIAGRILRKAG